MLLIYRGGNNGTTLTASIIANKAEMTWHTKEGKQSSNYIGSLTQSSTLRLGADKNGADVYIPFSEILPMVSPNDLVLGGWDINKMNIVSTPVDQ